MAAEKFSMGDAVQFGWNTLKENVGFLIPATLIMWIAVAIPSGLQSMTGYMKSAPAAIFALIFGLIAFAMEIFVNIAQIKISLRFCNGETADFPDLVNGYKHFWDFLVATVLYILLVLAGLILLIVPGIYWAIKYHFYGYLIIDRGMGPIDSFKKSGEITHGAKWYLFLFWFVLLGILILGLLACIVGIFAAIPVMMLAVAYVYRSLLSATEVAQQVQQAPQQPEQPAGPQEG